MKKKILISLTLFVTAFSSFTMHQPELSLRNFHLFLSECTGVTPGEAGQIVAQACQYYEDCGLLSCVVGIGGLFSCCCDQNYQQFSERIQEEQNDN